MSRQRFEAIMWSLHLSNPEEDEENDRKRNTAEPGTQLLLRDGPPATPSARWGLHTLRGQLLHEPCPFWGFVHKTLAIVGPFKKNLIGFPQTELNDLPKKAERGDLRWIRRSKLLFVKWMDSRECMKPSVDRLSGRKWLVCGRLRLFPDAVLDYNRSMGGVDVSNALIGYYSIHHKTMKWYKTFF
ncbi:hypothetical protein F7725_001784 [Dissostichus mawsoni]|uniref:PiggyBac transposable element-derived protein domain-containing protein n=1 Tax=Dissostichus mawsoni TaxID=36200 RepID=A0A7J5Y0K4_DISMA|nr:hypothetical protein F7725_001784 [Dissostichus mawsoni]